MSFKGGGSIRLPPPYRFFCDNSKVFELESSSSLAFLTNTFLRLKGFYTYCLSPQTYCLNALFYLYQAKSILRPIFLQSLNYNINVFWDSSRGVRFIFINLSFEKSNWPRWFFLVVFRSFFFSYWRQIVHLFKKKF